MDFEPAVRPLNNILQKLGPYQLNWLTDPRFTVKPALLIMGVWVSAVL
ncbi:MAG: hypothetical protein ACLR7U_08770 [Ruthenibacterium lactatiformans]